MGINARYYRKSAGNSGRDRRAPVVFDPRSGACGRFPLIPLHSRLPPRRHDPGPSPACENSPRPTIDGKRLGSKLHEQQPSTGTNRLAVTASMANPCFGGGGMERYSLVDGVEAGAHVFEGVVEARRQPLYEFQTSSRQTENNPNAGGLSLCSARKCMVRRLTAREKRRADRQICANVFGLCVESRDSWP